MLDLTIITTLYNGSNAQLLERSLTSIYSQHHMFSKALVYVDGPINQELNDILEKFKVNYANKTRIIYASENRGLGYGLNVLFSQCDGWTLKLDSDDVLLPSALNHIHEFISSYPRKIVCFTAPVYCSDLFKLDKVKLKNINTKFHSLRQRFNHSFLLVDCSKYSPRYDPNIILREDWDLDLNMRSEALEIGKLDFIPLIMHVDRDTKRRRKDQKVHTSEILIMKKIWKEKKSKFLLTRICIQLLRIIYLRIRNGL